MGNWGAAAAVEAGCGWLGEFLVHIFPQFRFSCGLHALFEKEAPQRFIPSCHQKDIFVAADFSLRLHRLESLCHQLIATWYQWTP